MIALYIYECSACGNRKAEQFNCPLGAQTPVSCPPAGWQTVDHRILCPEHKIEITIDGKPLR